MAHSGSSLAVHTEHVLTECWVGDANAPDLRLFRAPTVHDSSGTHKRLPHEISWHDLRKDDMIVALQTEEVGPSDRVISVLQFWRVLEVRDGEARVLVNNLVGCGEDGEFVYDRLVGLVGLPPSTRG
jgi:hypothetical protein